MNFNQYLQKFGNILTKTRSIKLSQKIFFVQQLSVMLKAGISLSMALKTLSEQTTNKGFREILFDLQQSVEKGNLLSKGLEKYHKIFGDLFINMIRAGEASGKLEDVLHQLFLQMKKDHELVAKVKGAMIYPIIVITMMVAIGILVVIYVIPAISGVFKELEVDLPLATRILIWLSDFALKYGIFLAIGAVIIIAGFVKIINTPKGKQKFHQFLLKLPIVSPIIKKINLARFCRTISSLLRTDIPIVKSFEITANVLGNTIYRLALIDAKEKIKKGVSIRQSLDSYSKIFPPVVLQMIAVGEDTGALDEILEDSANFYEEEVSQTMENLPSIIEPVLMVVLGIAVAGMAVAVIMPMYSLSQSI
ncbi:MAG: type II secretion system F family protein [Patescibacteria group bacterium]|jgi:type IV pilus assembly protein PilC|nr:type II secretion system F family protein [Patescibacteria group bacterium]